MTANTVTMESTYQLDYTSNWKYCARVQKKIGASMTFNPQWHSVDTVQSAVDKKKSLYFWITYIFALHLDTKSKKYIYTHRR